jgi:hypothetical protein
MDDQPTDLLETTTTSTPYTETYDPTVSYATELYSGIYAVLGQKRGYTPRNAQFFERGRGGYTGPIYGGRQNLQIDTIAGVSTVTSHAPSGIGWVPSSAWAASTWDNIPYNPTGKSTGQICAWVFPTANTMRGLRQLYESSPPFANPRFPTAAEIDFWNIKVINHFRALFGIGPITPSIRLYNEAQWSTERRWSPRFSAIPGDGTLVNGPCPNTNPHCGATFLPGIGDQNWLLLPGTTSSLVRQSVAEGLGGTNTNIPWSIKLARVIASFLCNEGLTGHTGPFLQREKIGMIFHDIGDGTTQVRFKFSGTFTAFP